MFDSLLNAHADAFDAACRSALAESREAVDDLKRLPPDAPFADVLAAYDRIGAPLNGIGGLTHLFFQAHPDSSMRERAAALEQEFSRFSTELSLDRAVYDRLAALDPDSAPDAVARRIHEHALRDYRRAGVDRDEATRTRVSELREEIVELGQEFARNIASDVREITVDSAEELEGLPEDFIASHPAGPDGRIRITTNPTDFMPFQRFARHRSHRRDLHRAFTSRGVPANLDVLDRLLARRHELANLLGYPHWAAYATEDKMIRTADKAAEFIGRVTELTSARLVAELEELESALVAEEPDAEGVRDYDRAYLTEGLRRERFAFDSRDVRPYLPYANVKAGVLETAGRLWGLTFRRLGDLQLWHPDVEAYEVLQDGTPIARFFLDMHPRDDKFKHAAMFNLVSGVEGEALASACLVCNLPRPDDREPALLDPGQMRTFFHEFGHLMHHLLAGRQRWLSVSGIATEWDFVEVPSQLFEEWSTSAEVLATFARHHETGEPIPVDLVERMNLADDYGKAVSTRVQMLYAALSLEYYRREPGDLDTSAVLGELKPRFVPFPVEEGTAFQAAFGHLDGYSALYYTYMWSLVLAKDCFSAFDDDLMNTEVAQRYRDTILAPGGSKDAEELVEDFLGRPYSFEAFEAWLAR